jgi:hypothetical protein
MTTVLFTRDGARYTLQFAYDRTVVDLLKATVPPHARSWSKTTKTWSVSVDWCRPLAATMRNIGCTVIGLDDARQQTHEGASWARSIFRAVGAGRVAAVHRALTKVLHPDNAETGSHELQRQLNQARAELEAR